MKQNQNINQEEDRLFLARKNNLEKIIQMGVDPYPKSFERSHLSTQVKDDLEKFEKNKINESLLENSVIAGRITAIRGQGKMIFIDLDMLNKVQGECFAPLPALSRIVKCW